MLHIIIMLKSLTQLMKMLTWCAPYYQDENLMFPGQFAAIRLYMSTSLIHSDFPFKDNHLTFQLQFTFIVQLLLLKMVIFICF